MTLEVITPEWRKSSHCDSSACLEVAFIRDLVLVRLNQDPDGPLLKFTRAEWDAFVDGAKDGDFDDI